ncbi:MAG: DinB family protein [Gemmatimonadales bacterium]|nr:DinB family protein [Gemmatimonadales bacterium]
MRFIFLALALASAPARAVAQTAVNPDLLADWVRNRLAVLTYIDAMPDSATNFRPAKGVRTLAGQFDHIVTTNLDVAAVALRGLKTAPVLADSTTYLHDKVALRKYAADTYDYFLTALKEATPAQLKRPVAIYGQPPQPAGRLVALALEHSVWTLGQVVPYLRLNGVTPPAYKMPF